MYLCAQNFICKRNQMVNEHKSPNEKPTNTCTCNLKKTTATGSSKFTS